MRGRLVVFEGIDGCGKTTQIGLLQAALARRRKVLRLREPGGTPIGERIREVLADTRHAEMHARTELLLFMASRAQLVEERIRPALARGEIVLLDRYYHSTAAYQGAAGKIGIPFVLDFAERTMKFPRPDLVLLLDLDPAEAARRTRRERDRVEAKGLAYQRRVRAGFLRMARADRRFKVIDVSGAIDAVHDRILGAVRRAL